MSNKKRIIVFVSAIAIIAIAAFCIFFMVKDKQKRDDNMANTDIQANMLYDLYTTFLGNFSTYNCNVVLDKSCLKNFITGDKFEAEQLDKIKSVEKEIESAEWTYELSMKYNKTTKEITLTFNNVDRVDRAEQKYKISFDNEGNNLVFEESGNASYIIE